MAARYLSREWLEAGRKLVEASPEFKQAGKGLTASLLNVITDAPGGKTIYLYYSFVDGNIEDLAVGNDPSVAKKAPEFKATGTYDTYVQVNQGKLGSTAAVFSRKIKLEGNLGKALRYVKPLEIFNSIYRTVPTVY